MALYDVALRAIIATSTVQACMHCYLMKRCKCYVVVFDMVSIIVTMQHLLYLSGMDRIIIYLEQSPLNTDYYAAYFLHDFKTTEILTFLLMTDIACF